jgi:uncharacterized oxidoreductase
MKLNGNTVFIAGATSGIGLGLALRLRHRGNTVIVGGRRADRLAGIRAEHPDIDTVVIDTADPDSITAAADEVLDRHPDLNGLVAMAGIMRPENLLDPAFLSTAESTVTTNLLGPVRLIAAFLPTLVRQERATVITVSSGLAYVPLPRTPTYCATKAAIHSFTESLRAQLSDTSVQVIELVPPTVQTALMNQQASPDAMPLGEYLDETLARLEAEPDAGQVLVERVRWLRNAEAEGHYEQALAMLAGH